MDFGDPHEPALSLRRALEAATRATRWGPHPDPIAQEILSTGYVEALEQTLATFDLRKVILAGAGASSIVFAAGDRVVRLGTGVLHSRPNIPEMLQPLAAGSVGWVRYEILPRVQTEGITERDVTDMTLALARRGYRFADAGADNLGRLNGRLMVIDAGAVQQVVLRGRGGYGDDGFAR